MKKKLFVIVTLLLLVNAISLTYIFIKKKENKFLKNQIAECNEKQLETEHLFIQSVGTKGMRLNSELPIISVTGDTSVISEIIDNRKIVFIFNKINCNVCVSREVHLLNKYLEEFGKKNVIVFAEGDYLRYLISFQKVNNLEIPIFFIKAELQKLIIGDLNKPFYCTIDTNLNVSNIFIPNEKNPEATIKYFKVIKNLIAY